MAKTPRGRHFSQDDAAFGAEHHFRMLVVRAGHPRNVFACGRADFFFASKHARLGRANATAPCTAVVMSVSAWLFPHIAENYEIELLEARSFHTHCGHTHSQLPKYSRST